MSYKLYPLATATGLAIPLEILKPLSHSALLISPDPFLAPTEYTTEDLETSMLTLWASTGTTLSFDPVTPLASATLGDFYLPANTIVQLAPPTAFISAIGEAAGILHINVIELWDTLATELQQNYG